MWIRPVLFLAATALVLLAPPAAAQPSGSCCRWTGPGWAWRAFWAAWRAGYGAARMAIEVHPEDGTLMVRGGQAAVLLLGVLILFRMGLRTGLAVEAQGRASEHAADLRTFPSSLPHFCSPCAVWRCILRARRR